MTETREAARAGGRVLVGIDDSDGAALALAYEPPYLWFSDEGLVPPAADMQHDAKQEAERIVAAAVQARRDRGLEIPATEVEVFSGPASAVLVRLSREADVLVVGHRGRGGVASHLIGSVGLNCVIHAACTVTVVRD